MEENGNQEVQQPQETFTERPLWQVWLARIGLVIFLIGVILYIRSIALGGNL